MHWTICFLVNRLTEENPSPGVVAFRIIKDGGDNNVGEQHKAYYTSEIGMIEVVGRSDGIMSVDFVEDAEADNISVHDCLKPCMTQLDEYFCGKRKTFLVSFQIQGTEFNKKVWRALMEIPYGTTQSYSDIAKAIGHKNAYRAVGNANRNNKIAIIIPCHRVIGSDGSLTGYACGIWRKEWLLAHERKYLDSP